ncbi:hypothetical protein Tco_0405594 [Tanacetum coccineum]
MSADSAITYTSVHSEARSWSIPSEDPIQEAARQYCSAAHNLQCIYQNDEAASPSTYHSLLPSGTPPLLPIPLPSTSRRADISEADTAPRKRLLLTTPRPGCEIGESSAAAVDYSLVDVRSRESSEFYSRHHDAQKDRAAVRAEIEVLRRDRLAYEQESMETYQALARSEAYCMLLEARVTVLETEVHRHEWQHQAADDFAVRHIIRTQALEAGARVDTLEDTGSSY